MINAHGSYPTYNGWNVVRNDLEPAEAMKMAGCSEEIIKDFPRHDPWVNKGFIIIGAALSEISALLLAVKESFDGCGKVNCPKGTRAIYYTNGSFCLIEKD